tara:strand:+ start:332 stop:655 length:324 start_codon:yes stop_codon:yes gene_type:complete
MKNYESIYDIHENMDHLYCDRVEAHERGSTTNEYWILTTREAWHINPYYDFNWETQRGETFDFFPIIPPHPEHDEYEVACDINCRHLKILSHARTSVDSATFDGIPF